MPATLPSTILLCAMLASAACSSIGAHDRRTREALDFGEPAEVSFCVLLDEGVPRERAERLLLAWNEREGPQYDLFVRIESFGRHERGGFRTRSVAEKLWALPLPGNCDRIIFFAGYDVRDTLIWPVQLWEVRGGVSQTGTHGFVMSALAHPGHLLRELAGGRRSVTIHEIYHMLGCEHAYGRMRRCYERIRALKRAHRRLEEERAVGEAPFFPTYQLGTGRLLTTRRQVRAIMGQRAPLPAAPAR